MKIFCLQMVSLLLLVGCARSAIPSDAPCEAPLRPSQRERRFSPAEPPKQPVLVMIDPGHGGKDPGTATTGKPVYQEKNLTLLLSKLVEGYLKQFGHKTCLSRSDDSYLSTKERVAACERAKAQLFVSLHFNAAKDPKAQGIEIFYYNSEAHAKRTLASKHFADTLLKQLVKRTKAKSRGVKPGNYHVIRETSVPAILVEGGFLTNKEEAELICSPAYLKTLARAIAEGIAAYSREKQSL